MVKQGIYRKIVCQYPADRKKGDMEPQFFCIYPDMWKKICFSPPGDYGQGTGEQFFYIYPGLCLEQSIPHTSVRKRTFRVIYMRREYIRISVLGSDQSGPVWGRGENKRVFSKVLLRTGWITRSLTKHGFCCFE